MDLWRVITIVGKKGKEEAKASPGAATSPVFLSFFLFVLSLAPPFRVFFSFLAAFWRVSETLYAMAKRKEAGECGTTSKTNEAK